MGCKGICSNHEVKSPYLIHSGRYELGQKRCSVCEVYLIWDKRFCPCCGTALRAKPRSSRGRNKMAQNLVVKKISSQKIISVPIIRD
jgi:predicted amidophosphoribosyltransferase